MVELPPIIQVGDVLLSPDILTEKFCCDLSACKGQCCVEGDAGAPVTLDEVAEIEACLDEVWGDLSASAQAVIDQQGVAYVDAEADLVTSIVRGRDCVFTYYGDVNSEEGEAPISDCCLCALEKACRAGKTRFMKPISCALYPIRAKDFGNGMTGLNYNRWKVCEAAVRKGEKLALPVYRFLEGPLTRRFGHEWYQLLCDAADELLNKKTNEL